MIEKYDLFSNRGWLKLAVYYWFWKVCMYIFLTIKIINILFGLIVAPLSLLLTSIEFVFNKVEDFIDDKINKYSK